MNAEKLFNKLVNLIFSVSFTLASVSSVFAQAPSNVSSGYLRFFCGNYQNQPATFIRTRERGNLPWIRWNRSNSGEGWSPERRCQEISGRLQRYYDNGTLKYIKTGVLNNQPVICVAAYFNGPCLPNGLLLTLSTDENPDNFFRNIIRFQEIIRTGPIVESANRSCIHHLNRELLINNRGFSINLLCLINELEESRYIIEKTEQENFQDPKIW